MDKDEYGGEVGPETDDQAEAAEARPDEAPEPEAYTFDDWALI